MRPSAEVHGYHYHDQAIYNQDCLMKYGQSSEWLGLFDFDEFLVPTPPSRRHASVLVDSLDGLMPPIGSIELPWTYIGGEAFSHHDLSLANREAWLKYSAGPHRLRELSSSAWNTTWSHDTGGRRWPKAIHRTRAVDSVWVHWAQSFRDRSPEDPPWEKILLDPNSRHSGARAITQGRVVFQGEMPWANPIALVHCRSDLVGTGLSFHAVRNLTPDIVEFALSVQADITILLPKISNQVAI